eukprot:scaffold1894_cov368-Prasinococcus_capsulatus_cf.AAC.9
MRLANCAASRIISSAAAPSERASDRCLGLCMRLPPHLAALVASSPASASAPPPHRRPEASPPVPARAPCPQEHGRGAGAAPRPSHPTPGDGSICAPARDGARQQSTDGGGHARATQVARPGVRNGVGRGKRVAAHLVAVLAPQPHPAQTPFRVSHLSTGWDTAALLAALE